MRFVTLASVLLLAPALRAGPDAADTKLLGQPAVSQNHIAFAYADDLWVADLDGANVRRLTGDIGVEFNPQFSPDGRTIAFSGQYDGNIDVYTIPVSGGTPKRLTTHPGPDVVRGWTPDGKAVLFSSPREVFTGRYSQLFTVPTEGGQPTKLPIPNGVEASFSQDGSRIAYTPLSDASRQWKHYRGGTHSRIWLLNMADHAVEQIPQPAGRCNDTNPCWANGTVYFRSDRNGEFNLFAYDTKSKQVQQLTKFTDFPVMALSVGGGNLAFEQAGHLHRFNLDSGESKRLKIGVAADLPETRARYVKGARNVRNGTISPSGSRAVLEFRGEIVTVPAEKGDPRNLTNSPGTHERDPAWSPDGKSIAYFSDEGGEYALHVRPADGKGSAKVHKLGGSGFYNRLTWSPDSKKVSYVDNAQALYVLDLDNGHPVKVAAEPIYSPVRTLRPAWSPDSKWVTYALGNRSAYRTVYVYSLADKKASAVTDGLSDASEPVFDASGKYLFFLASTDAGPVNTWFSQARSDMQAKQSIYLTVLKASEKSPLARESDEEKGPDAKDEKKDDAKDDKGEKAKDKKKPADVAIDFAGIDQRILALPLPVASYSTLQAGAAGQIFYLKAHERADDGPTGSELRRYDLTKRKGETVVPTCVGYDVTPDGKKAVVLTPGGPMTAEWSIIDTAEVMKPGKGKLNLEAVEVKVEPRAEWAQIFDEAWRVNRDFFYATNYHGADWPAMKAKYAPFIEHATSSDDVYKVVRWMLSELAVGHSYTTPAERPFEKKSVPGGLLGADYEVADGRYRFAKVYGGLNWSPEARSPLTVPGVNVKPGEYLLAVRGIELRAPTEVYSLFENTAGKSIEITVGPNADGSGSRTVTVEPIANESALRNRAWVEGNLKKVHDATDGRVAYVYVPNTAGPGHTYFKRYFYPQSDKDAIIVDERFNGGGSVADYYIDHLRRPYVGHWTTRYGTDFKTPQAAIHGPKVMLIDETAGSGGDLLPWMFRKEKLGPLVGKRTWGGLVGILGFPPLMDGGRVTAPDLAFWTPENGYTVENEGVPPDVEVEQWPAQVIAGKDPQLEKAIEIALAELRKNPPKKPERPAFPTTAKP